MTAALHFDDVTKEYRSGILRRERVSALQGFSIAVEPGEVFGFLGPNGSGKSTAIHIAMGFIRATRGGGSLLGRPFGDPAIHRRIGFLAENVAFYHLPAAKAVRFYGALNGVRDPLLRERARQLLQDFALADVAQRNLNKFSRGMLQRLGLVQALINDPELLILDEPTSALDPAARVQVRELVLRCKQAGKTIFLSSHLLSEVEVICDRVAFLARGKLMRVGRTEELLRDGERTQFAVRGIARERLATDLDAWAPTWLEKNGAANNLHHFEVSSVAARAVAERLWAAEAEIVSMNPSRRSLEELFLEMTSQADAAAGPERT